LRAPLWSRVNGACHIVLFHNSDPPLILPRVHAKAHKLPLVPGYKWQPVISRKGFHIALPVSHKEKTKKKAKEKKSTKRNNEKAKEEKESKIILGF